MALVDMSGITMDFPAGDGIQRVLHHVDLSVEAGQMTMIVGPSGCGKTTLLSIMTGILTPTSGTVHVAGTDITALRGDNLVRLRRKMIGFVFQQFHLLPALTAQENAAVPLLADGMAWDDACARAAVFLDRVGIGEHAHKLPNQLSGGQMQRVAFARALVHEPRLVVCDEPTSALDASAGQQVMDILRAVALKPDCAVVVVTHDNRIFPFADRMAHMSDGRVTHIVSRKMTERKAA